MLEKALQFFGLSKPRGSASGRSKFDDSTMPQSMEMATQLPVLAPPKVKSSQQTIQSYLTTATPNNNTPLPFTDRQTANTDTLTLRNQSTTFATIRQFIFTSPDLSATVNAFLRTAITNSYTAIAYNQDGTVNPDATQTLQQLLVRMDILKDYTQGFSGIYSLRSLSESFAKEILTYGACSCELALDKARLPYRIVPVSVSKLKWYPDGLWQRPTQVIGGEIIDLDIPTFFYTSLDQDLLDAYSSSPLESALQPVLFALDFMNDLRRVVKRAIHPRMTVQISQEAVMQSLPPEIMNQPEEIAKYVNKLIATVTASVNGLNPEDALVYLDNIDPKYMLSGNNSIDKEYTVLQAIIDAKVTTGAKALPSILGHGASANIASAETLLFMKNAQGAIQEKLNEMYSQVFTLALRLLGLDVYAIFRYAPIDLRPEGELEAFKAMSQSRILEQLSLGLISDEEACILLTGHLPPKGYKPLSGTGFKNAPSQANTSNPYSGTSTGADGNGGQPKPATPTAPKSQKGN